LLLLDEPTNHLDIPARDAFEEALDSYAGTVCFISHDRHFINAIASKVLHVHEGKIELFPGNFEDYETIWRQRVDADRGRELEMQRESAAGQTSGPGAATRKDVERKRQEAEWRNEFYRLKQPLQKQLDRLEQDLETTQQQLEGLGARLADPSTYQSGADVGALQREYQEIKKHIQTLTQRWEEQALTLEELETTFWKNRQPAVG
jgi:ATP-binding cassette subfamily F protein 3